MGVGMNIKTALMLSLIAGSLIGGFLVARHNWKRYMALYLFSSVLGILICYAFVQLGYYLFPFRLISVFPFPLIEMLTVLPCIVIAGVRFSPNRWGYKIPFYWVIVHLLMLLEVLALYHPLFLIEYSGKWDVWDSYTWWWIYLLFFEYVGGLIVPGSARRPIDSDAFRFGRLVWIVVHIILISTVFLAGVYVGLHL